MLKSKFMKVQHIIGADLSKKTIDVFCHSSQRHLCFENNEKGFKVFIRWLKENNINPSDAGIVMEHTGLYSYVFEKFLRNDSVSFVKVPALQIIRSQGVVRGKSDKIDAKRIALYGFEKQDRLIPDSGENVTLTRLKMLQTLRSGLVSQTAGLQNRLKEYKNIGIKETDLLVKTQAAILKTLKDKIKLLEAETQKIIMQDENIKRNYGYLVGVSGVGPVTAVLTIIKTGNFTKFTDPRKFSCFCGTAPFVYTSGTSIKGKTRISHLADKEMKRVLDLAAKSALQHDPEIKEYYQRRISEGKSKMSTINVLRNKIIQRMFAVIKRQSPYIKDYLSAA